MLRQLAPLATIISACIALLVLAAGAIYQSTAHVREETEFRTHTKDALDQIQATLRTLQASQSPKKVVAEIASLDSKQFAQNLPALRRASEPPLAAAAISAQVLHQVANKLRSVDENSQDYWPTVLQFLQFAREGMSPDVPAPGRPTIDLEHITAGRGSFGPFKHEIVRLDGVTLEGQTFENSRIIFTENPTRMSNVTFLNCVFEMPHVENPSPYLKQASQQLLA